MHSDRSTDAYLPDRNAGFIINVVLMFGIFHLLLRNHKDALQKHLDAAHFDAHVN